MLTAWLTAIAITLGIVLVMIGFALAAKALFFKNEHNEGY